MKSKPSTFACREYTWASKWLSVTCLFLMRSVMSPSNCSIRSMSSHKVRRVGIVSMNPGITSDSTTSVRTSVRKVSETGAKPSCFCLAQNKSVVPTRSVAIRSAVELQLTPPEQEASYISDRSIRHQFLLLCRHGSCQEPSVLRW